MLLVLALGAMAWPAGAADLLSCRSASGFECRAGLCERQNLHTNLTVNFDRKEISYCVGEGCYGARVAMVGAEDGGVSFAFDAKPEQGRNGGRTDGLVTIHPGRNAATIGNFQADGSVTFNLMDCGERP
ncbi:hypothetical protein A6A04_20745 [Paramagnetospirillum marisnigri]|uniref:Uncharacterized protein n=1 Tax=Paramagnetospirillum marisnigri TaxID=1285242 RepID=A0A178MBH1_9PROT|nr:hypothetical protein [Paramagnetospirillum marisnigri]OAN46099.1 hypothetical protein A6A04_20745 [Paramagnetospirillum marisnigri]